MTDLSHVYTVRKQFEMGALPEMQYQIRLPVEWIASVAIVGDYIRIYANRDWTAVRLTWEDNEIEGDSLPDVARVFCELRLGHPSTWVK